MESSWCTMSMALWGPMAPGGPLCLKVAPGEKNSRYPNLHPHDRQELVPPRWIVKAFATKRCPAPFAQAVAHALNRAPV